MDVQGGAAISLLWGFSGFLCGFSPVSLRFLSGLSVVSITQRNRRETQRNQRETREKSRETAERNREITREPNKIQAGVEPGVGENPFLCLFATVLPIFFSSLGLFWVSLGFSGVSLGSRNHRKPIEKT